MALRPASALLEFVQDWEPRIRRILLGVGLAWLLFAALAAGALAGINVLLGGPWWVHWLAALIGLLLLAPYVMISIVVLITVRAWRERVEQAARLERAIDLGMGGAQP